jgi:hypothetical protein
VENELNGLISAHEKNYGEAEIYKDLNEVIKSNIAQLARWHGHAGRGHHHP